MARPTTCGQWLADPDGYVARCIEPFGTEHSHHDDTARAAVAARRAAETTPDDPHASAAERRSARIARMAP